MIPIQILGGLFVVFAISRVVMRWRDHSLSARELAFWVLVFGGTLFVLIAPSISSEVAHLLGIGRGADLVIYGSIALLYYMVFQIHVRIEGLQCDITKLIRELALSQYPASRSVEGEERGAVTSAEAGDTADGS